MFARFRLPNRQKIASKRVISRRFASQYAREKKVSPRHLGVFDISKYWSANIQKLVNKCPKYWSIEYPKTGQQMSPSTTCLRSALTLVRLILDAQTAARAVAVNCVHHSNQMNCSSDQCLQTLVPADQGQDFEKALPCISIPVDRSKIPHTAKQDRLTVFQPEFRKRNAGA